MQIDVCLYRKSKHYTATDTEATCDITVGADHRAVKLDFEIKRQKPNRKMRPRKKKSLWGRTPKNEDEYQAEISNSLRRLREDWKSDHNRAIDLEQKCTDIENIIKDIGTAHAMVEEQRAAEQSENRASLFELIGRRGLAREHRQEDIVRDTSKKIQKEVRAMAKARRRVRVQRILEEFWGLKDIAKVKQDYKKQYIVNIKDPAGNLQTQRQGIADAFADFCTKSCSSAGLLRVQSEPGCTQMATR